MSLLDFFLFVNCLGEATFETLLLRYRLALQFNCLAVKFGSVLSMLAIAGNDLGAH